MYLLPLLFQPSRSGGKFYYYHCSKGCKERQKSEEHNKLFLCFLQLINVDEKGMELSAEALKQQLKSNNNCDKAELEKVVKEIEKNKQRLKNAQVLMLDGELNPSEYKELKVKMEEDVARLTIDENRIRQNSTNHYELVDPCLYLLKNIDKFYHSLDTHKKQRLMGSIFPEKFNIKDNQVRTTKINEAVLRICRKDRALGGNQKKQRTIFDALPCEVGNTGLEPVTPTLSR